MRYITIIYRIILKTVIKIMCAGADWTQLGSKTNDPRVYEDSLPKCEVLL
jgi:hypothetical protein